MSGQSDVLLMKGKKDKERSSEESIESKKVSMFARLCGMDAEDQTVDGLVSDAYAIGSLLMSYRFVLGSILFPG